MGQDCNAFGYNCETVTVYPDLKWEQIGYMGTQHIQLTTGVVFNTPQASYNGYRDSRRLDGGIVHHFETNPINPRKTSFFIVADGKWKDGRESPTDPRWYDQTGFAIAKGKFFRGENLGVCNE